MAARTRGFEMPSASSAERTMTSRWSSHFCWAVAGVEQRARSRTATAEVQRVLRIAVSDVGTLSGTGTLSGSGLLRSTVWLRRLRVGGGGKCV